MNNKVVKHRVFNWIKDNVGKTFQNPRPRENAKDIKILAVDDENGRLNIEFVGGGPALPLYFWMFERVIEVLITKRDESIRLGAKLTPPYDPETVEGKIWRRPHPEPPRTPFKASPHVCDLLVLAGVAKYEKARNPTTGRVVQGIRYDFSEVEAPLARINVPNPTPKSDKEIFVEKNRNIIIQWTERNKNLIINSRLAYKWKNKTTAECVKERNELSKTIILSRIKNHGGIDLETLDKVTKWGFNRQFPYREADKVMELTRDAFSFLDQQNLIDATKALLRLPGVGISRASKVLGLFDQENLCIYDSRVGQALTDLTDENGRIVLCPPGQNRPGDNISNSELWAEQYLRLIWTLEIIRDYLNDCGCTFRLADVEMALFIVGKERKVA